MAYPAIEHLAHIQSQIVDGIKTETKHAILTEYSWSDQMNATGDDKILMQTRIQFFINTSNTKRLAVLNAASFEELNLIVPMMETQ